MWFLATACLIDLILWNFLQKPTTHFFLMTLIVNREQILFAEKKQYLVFLPWGAYYFILFSSVAKTLGILISMYTMIAFLDPLLLKNRLLSSIILGILILCIDFLYPFFFLFQKYHSPLFTLLCFSGNLLVLCCLYGIRGNRVT